MPSPTGIIKTGTNTLKLTYGGNDYTGNTVVSEGTLELAPTGALRFQIGAGGVNNSLQGQGSAVLDGSFNFDLANASTNNGDSWTIVEPSLAPSYGPTFLVNGFSGVNGGNWTNTTNGVNYVFSQTTGVLSVSGGASAGNYANWLTNYPSLTGTNALASADPDGDGLSNEVEFSFGGNPTVGTPALMTARGTGTNAVVNWVERTNGVVYEVQTNGTLTNSWTGPAAVTISNSTDQSGVLLAPEYVRREFVVPASGRNFYRVRATVLPE
jgi:autotransporter-associated beta strand protein